MDKTTEKNLGQFGFGPEAMKQLKICPKCKTANTACNTHCSVCGVKLPGKTLFQQYRRHHIVCPVCDTILPASARFCPQCGTRQKPTFWKKIKLTIFKHSKGETSWV